MIEAILQFAQAHPLLLYGALFIATLIEGEIALILAGILVKNKGIAFFDAFVVALAAVMVHDISYWLIGRMVARTKRDKILGISKARLAYIFSHIKKREGFYIFLSKFAWGMNRFVLLSSGYCHTSFRRLIRFSIPAGSLWALVLLSLGYIFAEQTDILRKDMRVAGLILAVFLLAVLAVENYVRKAIRREAHLNDNK